MKALSIWQPYAHFIIHGAGQGRLMKDVENRTWRTNYRGRIAIHAGRDRRCCIQPGPGIWPPGVVLPPIEEMAFGAVIGTVELVDVVHVEQLRRGNIPFDRWVGSPWAWGPWCWLVRDPVPCRPISCRGLPSLFDLPEDVLSALGDQQSAKEVA